MRKILTPEEQADKEAAQKAYKEAYKKKTEFLDGVVKPITEPHHTQTVMWRDIERFIKSLDEDGGFNDSPEYQRGHVWTESQQSGFIENVMRRIIPKSLLSIRLNNPLNDDEVCGKILDEKEDWYLDLPREVQVVDGKQRLFAIRRFLKDELTVFNGMKASDFKDSRYDPMNLTIEVNTTAFTTQADVLAYYLDLNTGGTVHTQEEIQKVRDMLESKISAV